MMRLLIFDGEFGYLKDEINKGFVVLCHFEPQDNEKIIINAGRRISSLAKGKLILVPFAHLFEKVATKKKAEKLFLSLTNYCKKSKVRNVIGVPFGIEKEFFLYAPSKQSAIKFMKF